MKMDYRTMLTVSRYGLAVPCLVMTAMALTVCGFAAGTTSPLTVTLGPAGANIGETAEMPVSLQSSGTAPATVILFLSYDAAKLAPDTTYYSISQNGLSGAVQAGKSAVRPEIKTVTADKFVDTEVYSGVLAIAVTGMNTATLGNGICLSVAFKVLAGAQENEDIPVTGLDATQSTVQLANGPALSSAASASAQAISVSFVNASLHVGCSAIDTPTGVIATQGQSTGVTVAWTAIADASAAYQVLRGSSSDASTAIAVSDWQSAVSFDDTLTSAPVQTSAGGCFSNPTYTYTHYYYWVKARNAAGCESGLSTPAADGYRGVAKALAAAGDLMLSAGMVIALVLGAGSARVRRWAGRQSSL